MFKKLISVTLAAAIASAIVVFPAAAQTAGADALAGRGPGGGGRGVNQGTAQAPLSAAEKDALVRAIQEEYRARDLYRSVLDTLGNVAPFNTIVKSEQQHIAALERQASKYGVAVPTPEAPDFAQFHNLAEACQAGVDAEIADAELYDDLLAVTTHSDLIRVYTNLQRASLKAHLPAFEACN